MQNSSVPPLTGGNRGGSLLDALVAIARHHGRTINPDALISGLPLEGGQLRPSTFERAAQRIQFSSSLLNRHLQQINPALLPAVALLENDKACVINKINLDSGQVKVIFPELNESEVTLSIDEFEEQFSGYIIYCRPRHLFERGSLNEQSEEEGHWFWRVIKLNRPLYRDIILAAFVINILAIAMPLFVMNVYDRVVPNAAVETLWVLAIGLAIALVGDLVLKLLRSWFVDLAASRTDVRLSASLMEKSLNMRLEDRPAANGTFAAILQSFEFVRSFISSLTLTTLVDLPFFLLFTIVIGIIHWVLIIPILAGAVIILLYALSAQRNMKSLSDENMSASANRNALLFESLGSLDSVKSFNVQSEVQADWEKDTLFLSRNQAKMRLLSASVSNGSLLVQQLTGLTIIITGVYLLINGQLTQGGLIAAYLLSSRAMAPVSQISSILSQYQLAASAMESIDSIMQLPSEQPLAHKTTDHPFLKGEIEFRNVCYRYPSSEINAIDGLSFKIKAGERVAIIGKNGSGKSTLEKMILGLCQPNQGQVFIDGVEIRQRNLFQLRHQIGYVPQDVSLFKGSLQHNLLLSNRNIDPESLLKACDMAGLTPLIQQHPDGLQMQVGERGQLLSGGQRQAVAIARALINEPALLVLDEPTASLDHGSEELIKNNLATKTAGKTLILITHRSSLLSLANRLIVMDNGKIVADGPKETVMEALRQGRISGVA